MQNLEFRILISLEEAQQRLLSLTNQRFSRRGKLKVDESQLDENTIQFRVWVYPNSPDVEVVGFLQRITEAQTLVVGKAKTGCFAYYLPLAFLAFSVVTVADTGVEALVILIPLFIFGIGWGWHTIIGLREQLITVVEGSLQWQSDVKDYSVVAKRN